MIFIQLVLIAGLGGVLAWLLTNPNNYQVKALTKLAAIMLTAVAVYVILFPESSNRLAEFMGVTRGADLLLYLMAISFLYAVLNLYIKSKQEQKRTVLLARKIAIIEANERYGSGKDPKKGTS